MRQHPRRARRRLAKGAQIVLDRHGQTGERTQGPTGSAALIDLGGASQRSFTIHAHERMNGCVVRGDLVEKRVGQVDGRNLADVELSQQLDRGTVAQ